jgi:hypothetical protein
VCVCVRKILFSSSRARKTDTSLDYKWCDPLVGDEARLCAHHLLIRSGKLLTSERGREKMLPIARSRPGIEQRQQQGK